MDKQSSITVSVISQVLQWIGDMYHEFMQLIDGAKGAFPAARNTNLPCIPATRIETKPWSLFGKKARHNCSLILQNTLSGTTCSCYSGRSAIGMEISLWSALRRWQATLLHSRSEHVVRKMVSRKKSCQQWQTDAMCGRHQKSTTLVCWRGSA